MKNLAIILIGVAGLVNTMALSELRQRIEKLEAAPKPVHTCQLADSKGRYVCRFVTVEGE